MATLFLHVGHHKTGTSWIQSCLRLNSIALEKKGIIYASGDDRNIDNPNKISSGNAPYMFETKKNFEEKLAENPIKKEEKLLFSSEHLYSMFLDSNGQDYLEEIAGKYNFSKIEILLFIRNPISLTVSIWKQRIKREGNFSVSLTNLHEHPEIGWDIIFKIEDFLNRIDKCKNVNVTIRNYSHCSDRLLYEIAGWLNIPSDVFSLLPLSKVNRSLTYSEHIFQLSINKIIGRSGKIFSDPLCEKLPDIVPENILPPLEVQETICLALRKTMERLNLRIPEDHKLQCDIRKPDTLPDFLIFNQFQIECISKSLGNEIIRLRNQIENSDKTISFLKNENMGLRNNSNINETKEELNQKLVAKEKELIQKEDELDQIKKEFKQLINSKSWRITKPVRLIVQFFKGK